MKTYRSLKDFFNGLSILQIKWGIRIFDTSPVRKKLLNALLEHKKQLLETPFLYQDHGFKKHEAYQLVEAFEKSKEKWNSKALFAKVKTIVADLIVRKPIDIQFLMDFIEQDITYCKAHNRFCLPDFNLLRMIVKGLKKYAFLQRDYATLNRLIAYDQFYTPYFEINDEVTAYIYKVVYSARNLDWQKLHDIIAIGLTHYRQNKHMLDVDIKLNLFQFMNASYREMGEHRKREELLDELLEELCLIPYYDDHEYASFNLYLYYDNLTNMGAYDKAILFYNPIAASQNSKAISNLYSTLLIILNSYDLETAKGYINTVEELGMERLRPILYYLVTRYYIFVEDWKNAARYLVYAMKDAQENKRSAVLSVETYGVWIRYYYQQKDYERITKTFNNSRLKKRLGIQAEFTKRSDFEVKLYLLLTKYKKGSIKLSTFKNKLNQLILPLVEVKDGFFKLCIIENLNKIIQDPSLEVDIQTRKAFKSLQEEMRGYKSIVNQQLVPLF